MTTNVSDIIKKARNDKITELVRDFVNIYDNDVNKKEYIEEILKFFDNDIEDFSISKVYGRIKFKSNGLPSSNNYHVSHVVVFNKQLCIDIYNDNLYEMTGIYLKDKEKLTYTTIPTESTWKNLQAKYSELLYRLEDAIDAPISDIIKIG